MGSKVTPASVAGDVAKGLLDTGKMVVNIGGQVLGGAGLAAETAGKYIMKHTGGIPQGPLNPPKRTSESLSQKGSLGGSHARPDYTSHKK